jgi:hypothetical protein
VKKQQQRKYPPALLLQHFNDEKNSLSCLLTIYAVAVGWFHKFPENHGKSLIEGEVFGTENHKRRRQFRFPRNRR